MSTLDRQTLTEINQFKHVDVPNNAQDAIEKARAEARAARNANFRKQASELSKNYYETQVAPALQQFEDKTGVKLEQPKPTEIRDEVKTDDEVTQSAVQPSEKPTDEVVEDDALDDESLAVKVTRVVNGKKITKTVGEWMALADEHAAAEDDAAKLVKTSRESFQPSTKVEPVVVVAQPVVPAALSEEDLLNFVTTIQEGTKEEAAAAAKKLLEANQNSARAAAAQQNEKQAYTNVYNKILAENPDISGDRSLWDAACAEDLRLFSGKQVYDTDPFVNFQKRFQHAVDKIREWDKSRRGAAVAEVKKEELVKKKAKLKTIGSAASGRVEETTQPSGLNGAQVFTDPKAYEASVQRSLELKRRFQRGEITREQYDRAKRAG